MDIRLRWLVGIALSGFVTMSMSAQAPRTHEGAIRRRGNVHPLARPEFDRGRAAGARRLNRLVLLLQPDAVREAALRQLLNDQLDPASPRYRQWLTPRQFGERFGLAEDQLQAVVAWLQSYGLEVEAPPEGRRSLVFSGAVAQVEAAFDTEIHEYDINGEIHLANAAEPAIPAFLSDLVVGVAALHDFQAKPQYTAGSGHSVAPADFATIYNLSPVYAAHTDGAGQVLAVLGRSNVAAADTGMFRAHFGLPPNNFIVSIGGYDPGIGSNDFAIEADIDLQWAGAVARNAVIELGLGGSTTSDSLPLAAQNVVNENAASVISLSYGVCERALGSTANQLWNSIWQQAAAQGISVFVASGDSGAAGCDSGAAAQASGGLAVNGLCSSPYSTCVGGTDFGDGNASQYWAPVSDPNTWGSALSYIPEVAWNQSNVAGLYASGGGASSIYPKPAWQTGCGVPADGKRDVPDVALSASIHDAYLVFANGQMMMLGGTSVAAPAFAGLMALVNQRMGSRQGNANPWLYKLAAGQANGGQAVFHDIVAGNNSVPGLTGYSAGPGYDMVTGLGSVDANALVNSWASPAPVAPSFDVKVTATSMAVTPGGSSTVDLLTVPGAGYNSPVTFTTMGVPSGLSASFSPSSISPPSYGFSKLTVSVDAQTRPGTYNLSVAASGGGVTVRISIPVQVGPPLKHRRR